MFGNTPFVPISPAFSAPDNSGNGGIPEVKDAAAALLSGERKEGSPKLPERYTHVHSGKVRETYQHPDDPESLIMVATDRISTHDVIHDGLIPGKGKALTAMANYWFEYFSGHETTKDIPNQLSSTPLPDDFPQEWREQTVVVKKLRALPIEAIVRGYLYGSALKGYDSETGKLATGEEVGKGLQKCSKFDTPLFTPSTKSDSGDVNVNFETMLQNLQQWLIENGYNNIDAKSLAEQIQDYSLRMYQVANEHAQEKGLILGDTKFEFGLDAQGNLVVIDEVCTADSSRLWEAQSVTPGDEPVAKDKQPVRDYVADYWKEHPERDKKPVKIIPMVADATAKRYTEISALFSLPKAA